MLCALLIFRLGNFLNAKKRLSILLLTTLAINISFAQTREYLICPNDTFIYPQVADSSWYNINFGDGTSDSSYHSLNHVFAKRGKYNVLVKKTSHSIADTIKFVANVGSVPKPAFESYASCYLLRFTNQLPDTMAVNGGWLWNFGDGSFSTNPSPSHLYRGEDAYKVTLQYVRQNQCSSSITKVITARAGFYPGFDYHANQHEAIFLPIDTSEAHYHWDFGDRDTTDSISPVHAFNKTGKFPVSLTIISASGCETIYTDTISVTSAGIQPIIANSNLFAAYPNPFKNTLVIHYEIVGSKNVIIMLYDVTGKLALNINEGMRHTGRYDVFVNPTEYGLRAGLYILNACFDQEYLTQKLVME